MVLTVSAYSVFEKQKNVAKAIEDLQKVSSQGTDNERLRDACAQCEEVLKAAALPPQVGRDLESELVNAFGTDWKAKRFAVRSSAVGEDSEEMSAAGQMTTFLGVEGITDLLKSTKKMNGTIVLVVSNSMFDL